MFFNMQGVSICSTSTITSRTSVLKKMFQTKLVSFQGEVVYNWESVIKFSRNHLKRLYISQVSIFFLFDGHIDTYWHDSNLKF